MEFIKSNIPLITGSLLIVGMLNLMSYYGCFGINITSYLELTEVTQLQFKAYTLTASSFIVFIIYGLLIPYFKDEEKAKEKQEILKRDREEMKRKEKERIAKAGLIKPLFFKRNRKLIYVIIGFLYLLFVKIYGDSKIVTMSLVIAGIIVMMFAYAQIRKRILGEKNAFEIENETPEQLVTLDNVKITIFLVVISFASVMLGVISFQDTVSNISQEEITVYMKSDTLTTNANYRFVGKTKGYVFFYDIDIRQAEVYSTSAIDKMYIRDGIDYKHQKRNRNKD